MVFKLEDAVGYLETTLGSNVNLKGKVTWTYKDDTTPPFKDYGVHLYLGLAEPKQVEYRKIGPIATESWQINCDVVLNKSFKARDSVSNSLGISYWENYMVRTLFHKQNNGTFRDSWWDSMGVEDYSDSHVIRGLFNCQYDNQY
jgi:hypothetical protein